MIQTSCRRRVLELLGKHASDQQSSRLLQPLPMERAMCIEFMSDWIWPPNGRFKSRSACTCTNAPLFALQACVFSIAPSWTCPFSSTSTWCRPLRLSVGNGGFQHECVRARPRARGARALVLVVGTWCLRVIACIGGGAAAGALT